MINIKFTGTAETLKLFPNYEKTRLILCMLLLDAETELSQDVSCVRVGRRQADNVYSMVQNRA